MTRKRSRKAPARASGHPASRGVRGGAATPPTPATVRDWIGAARPRTLPLAITPVLIGTGAALVGTPEFHWVIALACLLVSVSLQVAVNFANDYSDGVRGTDRFRVGPQRLTASGKAKPHAVLAAALLFFGIAGIAGVAIVIATGHWWLLIVGVVCIVAAWFYTGGKRPYGYTGLGEVFVFIFFGLVATVGTTYVQAGVVTDLAWFGAVAAGLLACAVLLANNLRDIDQDRKAGKRTLTVLIGRRATQVVYTLFVLAPFAAVIVIAPLFPIAWLALFGLLPAMPAVAIVWAYRDPRELVTALALTSIASLVYGAALFWAWGYWTLVAA